MRAGRFSRRDILKASGAAAMTVFATPLRAAAPEPTAITPALINAATKEGKVVYYTSIDLPVS
jgi:iron(III) transport system substrate-binding protein